VNLPWLHGCCAWRKDHQAQVLPLEAESPDAGGERICRRRVHWSLRLVSWHQGWRIHPVG